MKAFEDPDTMHETEQHKIIILTAPSGAGKTTILKTISGIIDPRKGALTQIFEEYRPDGTPVIIETVVEQVDSLVSPVRGTGWQSSHPGDRTVRQELRLILKNSGLPPAGELFDRAYAYIRENY